MKLVLFDAGETLLHPDPSWEWHFWDECAAAGVEVDIVRVGMVFRREVERFADRVEETTEAGFSVSTEASTAFWTRLYRETLAELGASCPGDLPERLYRRFASFDTYDFFEDAIPTIEAIKAAGHAVGVVSKSTWSAIRSMPTCCRRTHSA